MNRRPKKIIFYDGNCGLCTRSVRFIMARDRNRLFHFAPLQGETAKVHLPAEMRAAENLSTMVYLELNEGAAASRRFTRANAALLVGKQLGGLTAGLARLGLCFPQSLRDWVYTQIAKRRGRFGSVQKCRRPTPEEAARILD